MIPLQPETLHPRADQPLTSCTVSHDAGRRRPEGSGSRHHLFNRTVAPSVVRPSFVLSGFTAQSVRVRKLEICCFAAYARVFPKARPALRSGPAELNAGAPRRYQPRHSTMATGTRARLSRGPGPELPTGSRSASAALATTRPTPATRRAGQRARWQRRYPRRCRPLVAVSALPPAQAAAAQESAGTARRGPWLPAESADRSGVGWGAWGRKSEIASKTRGIGLDEGHATRRRARDLHERVISALPARNENFTDPLAGSSRSLKVSTLPATGSGLPLTDWGT